jgi:broad specificity phosphatase PhoE
MKPRRIFVVRHAESAANVDNTVYQTIPDHDISITDKGRLQAVRLGNYLTNHDQGTFHNLDVYCSSFRRAEQTWGVMHSAYSKCNFIGYDPRIRERDWCQLVFPNNNRIPEHLFNNFYYRFEGGESGADVYTRVASFFQDIFHRDHSRDILIVTHGATAIVIKMYLCCLHTDKYAKLPILGNVHMDEYAMLPSPSKYRHIQCHDKH